MNKLPIGIQSFEKIRSEGYVYVDKTEQIHDMISSGSSYILSRPRRFGKSLLVSTIAAYFEGRKELFHDLAIEKYEQQKPDEEQWISYPVILFSLSGGDYSSPDGLEDMLNLEMERCRKRWLKDDEPLSGSTLSGKFASLIEALYHETGRKIVVLVDEYDKPLLETAIINEAQEEKNRTLFKSFFSVLKDKDFYLQFVFFTGVTKFSRVSVFSDLNQLKDISLSDRYAAICGLTEVEMKNSFTTEIKELADANGYSENECYEKLRSMYDGYRFSGRGEKLYNPFSLLNAFYDKRLGSYWFDTGTPTFLIHKLESTEYQPEDFTNGVSVTEQELSNYRIDDPNPVPLFYQAGYLTIRSWSPEFQSYTMCFPNEEVKYSFLQSLLNSRFDGKGQVSSFSASGFVTDLRSGRTDDFMIRLRSLFSSIPYAEGPVSYQEREWRNQMYLVFTLLGQYVRTEIHSAQGRCDCIAETKDYVYVFEFKQDGQCDDAMKQIKEHGYAEPYRADGRKIILIGAVFSEKEKTLSVWKAETLK